MNVFQHTAVGLSPARHQDTYLYGYLAFLPIPRIWRERWIGKGFQMLPQHVKIKFKSQHGAKHYCKRKRKTLSYNVLKASQMVSYFRKFILGERKLLQGSGNIGLHITKGCFPKQSRTILLRLLFSIYPTSLGQRKNVWKRL